MKLPILQKHTALVTLSLPDKLTSVAVTAPTVKLTITIMRRFACWIPMTYRSLWLICLTAFPSILVPVVVRRLKAIAMLTTVADAIRI